MNEFMGLIPAQYDAKAEGFLPGGASLHNCMSGHGPDAETFERAAHAELKPVKLDDTLAFMFETRLVVPADALRPGDAHAAARILRVLAGPAQDVPGLSAMEEKQRWEPSESYPDPAVQILDPELRQIPHQQCRASSGSPPACAGARGRSGSATRAACCGATFPTTASCAGTRRPAASASSASPPTTPTAIPATARAGSSPASMARGASRAPNTTAAITVLIDKFDGKPLNSPNDVVVKSDDSIWFTDPPFGILGNYEGDQASPELPTNVYRARRKTGEGDRGGRRDQRAQRPLLLARRDEDLHRRQPRRRRDRHPRLRRGRRRHQARQRPHLRTWRARRQSPTASAATSTAISGAAGAPGRTINGVVGVLAGGQAASAASRCPSAAPISASAALKRNRLFMAASQSLYALYVNTQGVAYF